MNPAAIPVFVIDLAYAIYMLFFIRKTLKNTKLGEPASPVHIVAAVVGVFVLIAATIYVLQLD